MCIYKTMATHIRQTMTRWIIVAQSNDIFDKNYFKTYIITNYLWSMIVEQRVVLKHVLHIPM